MTKKEVMRGSSSSNCRSRRSWDHRSVHSDRWYTAELRSRPRGSTGVNADVPAPLGSVPGPRSE